MEIVGLGTDLVECVRVRALIDRYEEQFLRRVFTPREIRICRASARATEAFAQLWAGKEAVLKSLGYSRRTVPHRSDVEIIREAGRPKVELLGAIRDRALERGVTNIMLSLAADRNYATATAIAIKGN